MSTSTETIGGQRRWISIQIVLLVLFACLDLWAVPCDDHNELCGVWAVQSECRKNPGFMLRMCPKSCQTCILPSSASVENLTLSRIVTFPFSMILSSSLESETTWSGDGGGTDLDGDGSKSVSLSHETKAGDDDDVCLLNDPAGVTGEPNMLDVESSRRQGPSHHETHQATTVQENNNDVEEEDDGTQDMCMDLDESCLDMVNECAINQAFMNEHCPRTCGQCDATKCTNGHRLCSYWASLGECSNNPNYMLKYCSRACDYCPGTSATKDDISSQLNADGEEVIVVDGIECKDKHDSFQCAIRKRQGECERNPGWMTVFCGRTCNHCELMPSHRRCRPEVFHDPEYRYESRFEKPGQLTEMFQDIVHSLGGEESGHVEVLLRPPKGPWMIKIPNFASDEEIDTLLSLTLSKVKRSTDQGQVGADGVQEQVVSQGRTSSNAWCLHDCSTHPIVSNLTERISSLLQTPSKNFESYQVLQYKVGQQYVVHHDSSQDDVGDLAGPRILTFFMYFSDVEQGGETYFNKLGVKVKPKKGMAVLWPSVLDEDPRTIDQRTTHAALPVIKGEKLAANVWVHMRDFAKPNLWGCTGAFD